MVGVFSEGDEEETRARVLHASEILDRLFRVVLLSAPVWREGVCALDVRHIWLEEQVSFDNGCSMNLLLSSQKALLLVSRPGEVTLLGRLRTESLSAFSSLPVREGTNAVVADHRIFPFCTDESIAVLFDLQSLGDLSACALSATMLTQEGAISFAVISVSRNRRSAIIILSVKEKRQKGANVQLARIMNGPVRMEMLKLPKHHVHVSGYRASYKV
jgi:hypothetical protein